MLELLLSSEAWSAIIGALLGAWITYRFALHLAEKQFNQMKEISRLEAGRSAAANFIDAFSPEVAILRSGTDLAGDASDLLRLAYDERHSKAVEIFAHYLPEKDRKAFRNEWLCHCYGRSSSGEPNSPHDERLGMSHNSLVFQHFGDDWSDPECHDARKRALASIERLLAYANVS